MASPLCPRCHGTTLHTLRPGVRYCSAMGCGYDEERRPVASVGELQPDRCDECGQPAHELYWCGQIKVCGQCLMRNERRAAQRPPPDPRETELAALRAQLAAARAALVRAHIALERFGDHKVECMTVRLDGATCDCGLALAIERTAAAFDDTGD